MPLFQLREDRYVNTDHIADITYTPAGSLQVVITSAADQREIERLPSNASYLNMELKSQEAIHLEGEEADAVWAAFQRAMQRQPETQ